MFAKINEMMKDNNKVDETTYLMKVQKFNVQVISVYLIINNLADIHYAYNILMQVEMEKRC